MTELLRNIRPFELERYFARYEFSAPWLLSSSDCESLTVEDLLKLEEGAAGKLLSMRLGYTESTGAPSLKKEISGLYDNISPDQILVHAGAQEVIYNFMRACLKPGDEIIVQYPCYQSLHEAARAAGARIVFWGMEAEKDCWRADIDKLEKLVAPYTKALVINTPHSPTGHVFSLEEKRKLAELADRAGAIIFSDEVYRFTEFEKPSTPMCDISENAVSLGVMSKSFGLAGLRIGWAAMRNPGIMELLKEYKDYTTICSAGPSEYLSEIAIRNRVVILKRNNEIIRKNCALLQNALKSRPDMFTWRSPEGSPVAFVEIIGPDAAEFCQKLVDEAGVLLLPGHVFGKEYARFIRFGMGRSNMPRALERFMGYVDKYFK